MRSYTLYSIVLLVISIVLLPLDAAQIALHLSGTDDGTSVASSPTMGSELAAMLKSPKSQQENDTYRHALTLILSLKTSATCTRVATSTLLTSCQEIERSTTVNSQLDAVPSEIILNEVKSVYAARLAVCELLEAGAVVPSQCTPFIPDGSAKRDGVLASYFTRNKRASTKGKGNREKADTTKLVDCLKGLESKPQWWTSYSNARQNAVVICQAVRGEIEKDELLNLHEAMTDVTSTMAMSLSEAVERASTHLARQKEFAESVHELQRDVQEQLDRTSNNAQRTFSGLIGELESTIRWVFGKLITAGEIVDTQYAGLNQNILRSTEEVDAFRKNVGKLFEEMVQGSSELAAQHTNQWVSNQDMVNGVLGNMQMGMNALIMAVSGIENQLEISRDRSGALDERLLNIGTAFDELEAKFQDFRAAQDKEREFELQHRELLHREMHAVLYFMEQVTNQALNLQSVVNETSTRLEDIRIPVMLTLLKAGLQWHLWPGVAFLPAFIAVTRGSSTLKRFCFGAVFVCAVFQTGLPSLISRIYTAIRGNSSVIGAIFTGPRLPTQALISAGVGSGGVMVIKAVAILQTWGLFFFGLYFLWLYFQVLPRYRGEENDQGTIQTLSENYDGYSSTPITFPEPVMVKLSHPKHYNGPQLGHLPRGS